MIAVVFDRVTFFPHFFFFLFYIEICVFLIFFCRSVKNGAAALMVKIKQYNLLFLSRVGFIVVVIIVILVLLARCFVQSCRFFLLFEIMI